MRALGDMPKRVMLLEALGILLLVLAYLSLHQYLILPAGLSEPTVAIMMIFIGIGLMIPAAACIVWRVAQGFGPLLGMNRIDKKEPTDADKKTLNPKVNNDKS
ncbi:YbjC family protein [Yersinia ruckeri]|uniref:YbjC family protein n=1 Tax=Yersinia ruckeri TaxID=29486 RepID=UPI0020BF2667|nr:YbjC family protein [Yersinia ruckeri]UZY12595.1 YbjC family protein [Yersinia ruckeri]